jgi:hypothetical protein
VVRRSFPVLYRFPNVIGVIIAGRDSLAKRPAAAGKECLKVGFGAGNGIKSIIIYDQRL